MLIMMVAGPFAFIVLSILTIPGDAATTAYNIKANEGLFIITIASFLIVITLDMLLAWTFYVILKLINKIIALLMALF